MKKTVVAIGNFDGVHLGHRDVLQQARILADHNNYDFCVLTFTPHPRSVFQPNIAPFRISPDPVKKDLFDTLIKPDIYEAITFDNNFQHLSANDFIDTILIDKLNAGFVIVGKNFHFGYQRQGTIETLHSRNEFETMTADLLNIGTTPVSSTRIREHLKNAELKQANALLGWDWYIQSEVVHGDKRGREIGYPTANMHFGDTIVPSHGIYAVKIQIEGQQEWLNGAANIGIRPMFETAMPMIETYIFDFNNDLYGQRLKIQPVQKIRDEMKLDSLNSLKSQIAKDCATIRAILEA